MSQMTAVIILIDALGVNSYCLLKCARHFSKCSTYMKYLNISQYP